MPTRNGLRKVSVKTPNTRGIKELKNASIIFQHTVDAVDSFYGIYQKSRKGSKGTSSHQEQDLLRAMLVFACSGLDAVVKQLIKDSLEKVIEEDKTGGARKEFQKFVERRLRKVNILNSDDNKQAQIDINFITQIITSSSPRKELITSLQRSLINDSLQSTDQLLRVAAHFAIMKREILEDPEETKKAFNVRNSIIHEMDANLDSRQQGRKKRKMRNVTTMLKYVECILNIGVNFINTVAKKIYGFT